MYRPRVWSANQVPMTIEEAISYDDFIKSQLAEVKNENVVGVRCDRIVKMNNQQRPLITYQGSEFNRFSDYIKDYNESNPSFTKVFQDTDQCIFFNKFLMISDWPIMIDIEKKKKLLDDEFMSIYSKTNLSKAFLNAEQRTLEFDRIRKETDKLKEVAEEIKRTFNIPNYSRKLFNGDYDDTINAMENVFDNDKGLFVDIQKAAETGKKVCVLTKVKRIPQLHTVATIFWYRDGKLTCAMYDPIYNSRDEKNSTKNYLWALNVLYYNLKLAYRGTPIDIINLSLKYCVTKEGKGLRCPQYYIDAEYCTMFSLYFLFCYAKNGGPDSDEGLKKTVDDSYIVSPSELAREPCIASNKFRLVSLSFILTVLTNIADDNDIFIKIQEKYDQLKPSYTILADPVYNVLKEKSGAYMRKQWQRQYDQEMEYAMEAYKRGDFISAASALERAQKHAEDLKLDVNLNEKIANAKGKIAIQKAEAEKGISDLQASIESNIAAKKYDDALKKYYLMEKRYQKIGIYTLPKNAKNYENRILFPQADQLLERATSLVKEGKADDALQIFYRIVRSVPQSYPRYQEVETGRNAMREEVRRLEGVRWAAERAAPPPAGSPGQKAGRRKTRTQRKKQRKTLKKQRS